MRTVGGDVESDLVPTYSYACKDCGHAFDIQQAFTDDALTVCPECDGSLRKVFSAVGVVFKGSGFYRTDSRGSRSSGAGGSGTSESGKGESGKGGTGAAGSGTSGASTGDSGTSGSGGAKGSSGGTSTSGASSSTSSGSSGGSSTAAR